MKPRSALLTLVILLLSLSRAFPLAGLQEMGSEPVRVLFIGNSMTHFHDLPGEVKRVVEETLPSLNVEVRMHAPNGESLQGHRNSGKLEQLLQEGDWDWVVLQERGLSTVWILDGVPFQDPPDGFFREMEAAVALVRGHGAEPILYQTWGGTGSPEAFSYHDYAFMEVGRRLGVRVAPVGRVWAELAHDRRMGMLDPDGLHPSPLATHAAAWTLASTLFTGLGLGEGEGRPLPEADSAEEGVARSVALRHAGTLGERGGWEPVPRPEYRTRPVLRTGDRPLMEEGVGRWRSRDGGTRLSFGTELRIEMEGGIPTVQLREYTASGILTLPAEILASDDGQMEIAFRSSAVDFRLAAVRRGEALEVLTRRGVGGPREEYRTARYERVRGEDGADEDAAWFSALDHLFLTLAEEEEAVGLTEALRRHYPRLQATLGDETILAARQGFAPGEWDPILTAWHHLHLGEVERALRVYQAGVELHPTSLDLHTQYERALVEVGRTADAVRLYRSAIERTDPEGEARLREAFQERLRVLQESGDGAREGAEDSCTHPPEAPSEWREDLETAWRMVDSSYAYLDRKRTHWPSVRCHYLEEVEGVDNPQDFVNLLESMLGHLYDHHLHLGVSNERSFRLFPSGAQVAGEWREFRARITAVRTGSEAERAGVLPGMEVLSVDGIPVAEALAAIRPRFAALVSPAAEDWALRTILAGRQGAPITLGLRGGDGVREVTLSGAPPSTREGHLTAQRLEGNIGYIRIHDALASEELIHRWDAAIAEMADTDGLILDLRDTPSGGTTTVARGLMGRLVTEVGVYQRHEDPLEERAFGVRRSWLEEVSPRGPFAYTAPMVVLVDRWTGSMGEGVAIGLDAMDRAVVIGTPMAGLAGAVSTFTLPRTGIQLRVPTERLFHIDGTPREEFLPLPPAAGLAALEEPFRNAVRTLLTGEDSLPLPGTGASRKPEPFQPRPMES